MASAPFIGEIRLFAGNFAPRAWAFCDGRTLVIADNNPLFALIGTTYGGDGVTSFNLPDLRGRVAAHQGQGPGTSNYVIGQQSGTEEVTLNTNQMPSHSHAAAGSATPQTGSRPANKVYGKGGRYDTASPNSQMSPAAPAGGSQPHDNMQPYLGMNYIICLEGLFPSRN